MTKRRLIDYLAHMAQATQRACDYTDGMSKETFLADTRTQQAVIMNLMIMGEIVTKLLQDHAPFLDAHEQIPWRSMKGMRNRIAHGYFDINLDVVWDTVQTALPKLRAQWPAIRTAAENIEPDD
jgi:uncharacterized protein with HEPN domain